VSDRPTVVRFPKGRLAEPLPAASTRGSVDLLHVEDDPQVLLVGVGSMAAVVNEAAAKLSAEGVRCVAAAPLWVTPLPPELVALAGEVGRVVTVEDNGVVGGIGAALVVALADAGLTARTVRLGIPQEFLDQATRPALLEQFGLTAQGCAAAALGLLADPA
jgi:1-deoxy-D-xylulose-5-phosphate synthase